jgi:putative ABC transport system substrate-binding protein
MSNVTRRRFIGGSFAAAGLGLLAGCTGLPRAPWQSVKIPRVGVLISNRDYRITSAEIKLGALPSFFVGLRELGYVDGETIHLELRGAEGREERLPALAQELLGEGLDVLVAGGGTPAAVAAKQAAGQTPVVFLAVSDPVRTGLVASFARPGGTVTGTSNYAVETSGKQLELLREVAPACRVVDVVGNMRNPAWAVERAERAPAAAQLGITMRERDVGSLLDIEQAFREIAVDRPDALFGALDAGLLINAIRPRFLELVSSLRLPAMHGNPILVEEGGLMYYGVDLHDVHRRGAHYVDQILRGVSPGDLPVQRPAKFDFVVNVRTANAQNITIPETVRAQATRLIE